MSIIILVIIILSSKMLSPCNGYVEISVFPEKLLTCLTQGSLILVNIEVYKCLQTCLFISFYSNRSYGSILHTESTKRLIHLSDTHLSALSL